ncbi:MAG: FixH family protein [Bacteroidota bacterium]
MNWGYKILIVYLAFVAGIVVMVVKSSTQKIDLVTQDYYTKELKYQERIDAVKRTEALSSKVKYEVKNGKVVITLPAAFDLKAVNGNVLLYYAADNSKDVTKDFTTNNRTITIELPITAKGPYQLQISWISEGHAFYFEENLFL